MPTDFVHLHLHTDYSMLDGACKVGPLAEKIKELGQHSVAMTDHGNMSATFDFYTTMKKSGIKPIIGCEFYMTPYGIADHSTPIRHHLVLLAKDYEGYRNLCELNAIAWSEDGFYYKPRIDRDAMARFNKGIICMTACIGGEVPHNLLKGNMDAARTATQFYVDTFGKDNFFIEIQDHGMEEEKRANPMLAELAKEFGVGLVATNDAHYINQDDAKSHDALLCIGTQSKLADERRMRFPNNRFYVTSTEEMAELFKDYPEALENTIKIAERCNVELPIGKEQVSHYPVYRLPDKADDEKDSHCPIRKAYLRDICVENMESRYGIKEIDNPDYAPGPDEPDAAFRKEVLERMDFELGVIDNMGFISYFLVVWDFINYARSIDVPVGPGRGSGAGSIVAYLTGITDLDPLRYGLLFERFLNPDRVSPPDFDIDFCERRRGLVIDYVREKYGTENVAQIGTYGTLKAKAVLKDVARVKDVPFAESNRVVGMIPTDPKMTLAKANELPEISTELQQTAWVREMFELATPLEGLNRNQSIHACGVIIGDMPLSSVVPLARGAGKEVITQFPAYPCEEFGLLKMDFLGLKTLTIIQDTIDMVNAKEGGSFCADDIELYDSKTYDLLNRGETVGVFQLESGGMQDLCRKFQISKIEEIIALVALYRPGPMEFIPTYINCKLGKEKPEYETPEMEKLLSETYGIMVYQEQIMQVVQAVAGFSLAQADIMRRAIGKKKEEVLIEQGELFKAGCLKMGHSKEIAERIWAKILKFASYGFNKSHSACYALLSYRTAYLKANYPAEFMAAILNSEINNSEKLAFYIAECKAMGLKIMPPDINGSNRLFGVDNGDIRFGLGGLKGMGTSAADEIIHSREADGTFDSLMDFCERVDVNKRVLEHLTKAGAFDTFGLKRSQTYAILDDTIQRVSSTKKDRAVGQETFFDLMLDGDSESGNAQEVEIPDIDEWDWNELLRNEKELLGFYVSGHPLDRHERLIRTFQSTSTLSARQLPADRGVRIGGLITALSVKTSKRDGRPWAIVTIEDMESTIECLCFADEYAEYSEYLRAEGKVFIEGHISRREGDDISTIRVSKVMNFHGVKQQYLKEIHVTIDETNDTSGRLDELKSILASSPGRVPVVLSVKLRNGDFAFIEAGHNYCVELTDHLETTLKSFTGQDHLVMKADTKVEDKQRRRWENRMAS